MIDTMVRVSTPDGLIFDLRPAGPVVRLLALIIDQLCLGLAYYIIGIFMAIARVEGGWLMYLIVFALTWFYFVIFDLLAKGRSPGKLMLGLQVVMADGSLVTAGASMLRNILRVFDFFFALGFLASAFGRDFRRPGDMVAGTLVVYTRLNFKSNPMPVLDPAIPARTPEKLVPPEAAEPLLELVRRGPALNPRLRRDLAVLGARVFLHYPQAHAAEREILELAAWHVRHGAKKQQGGQG